MEKREKIDRICAGKTIRIFSARPDLNTVSFVETYRNCGKRSCVRCRDKRQRPHGPYWNLNYTDEHGKPGTLYIGRLLPEIARKHSKVLFSDVMEFYKERDRHEESVSRYRTQIGNLKLEIERLYEELRSAQRFQRKNITGKAQKFFRQLVSKYHPDRHGERTFLAEDVMKDLNQLIQLVSSE